MVRLASSHHHVLECAGTSSDRLAHMWLPCVAGLRTFGDSATLQSVAPCLERRDRHPSRYMLRDKRMIFLTQFSKPMNSGLEPQNLSCLPCLTWTSLPRSLCPAWACVAKRGSSPKFPGLAGSAPLALYQSTSLASASMTHSSPTIIKGGLPGRLG